MRADRRGNWIDTRRELGQIVWAVLLIDLIAIGLGALASRTMGSDVLVLGFVLAGIATVVFVVIVAGNLVIEYLANWWITRAHRRP